METQNQQPTTALPESDFNSPTSKAYKSHHIILIISISIALFILSIGTYLVLNQQIIRSQQTTHTIISVQPSLVPTTATSPAASDVVGENWKTYVNEEYHYQFRYPDQNWHVDWEASPNFGHQDIQTFDEIDLIKIATVPQIVLWMRFSISVQPNTNQLSLKEIYYFGQYTKDIPADMTIMDQFEGEYLRELRRKVGKETTYPEGVEETTFLSKPALKQINPKWGLLTFNIDHYSKDSHIFNIRWSIEDGKETPENAQRIFDQILSTFKFD